MATTDEENAATVENRTQGVAVAGEENRAPPDMAMVDQVLAEELGDDSHKFETPVSQEQNNQSGMMLPHAEATHMMMMLSDEHDDTQMLNSHDPLLLSHEENNQMMMMMGNHHHIVMDEDNNNDNNNNQLMFNHEGEVAEELMIPDSQPSNKRRRRRSVVWEHFTVEAVNDVCKRAFCKQCRQSFAYKTGAKVAGTSHLKRHIAKGKCLALLRGDAGTEPLKVRRSRYRSPTSAATYIAFDPDHARQQIAKMIILHDYPLHMVEHPGFLSLIHSLHPQFGDAMSFNTIHGDCIATYLKEKQNVMKFIQGIPGRVSLTLDMWTSSDSIGYVFITAHFIDADWKPQKLLLNVEMEPFPDSDSALSHAVVCSLADWGLESKLLSVTFNHPVGESGFQSLRSLLCMKNTSILRNHLVLGNCISHTLTSMAKDVMFAYRDLITKIRNNVKHVKTLDSNQEKFLELKQQLQVPTDKNLRLDDQTQWNTTYEMLLSASELKQVFSCLDTCDPHYKYALSLLEWKQVETICSILKHLVDAANILASSSVSTSPISITFFHETLRIQSELSRLAARGDNDPFLNSFINSLQEKIEKYVKDCCLVLGTAVVMDPQLKMKFVEFSLKKIYGEENAQPYIKVVNDGVHELFREYEEENVDGGEEINTDGGGVVLDNDFLEFDKYIETKKSELDMYLDDSLLARAKEFDVLKWWRDNKMKYPRLSKMARDVLSIQVSTASAEKVFDTVLPRQLDRYRSTLRTETVEAMVCAKDWMLMQRGSASDADAGRFGDVGVVKIEF
ncbi:Zinc finger BED domain-containing protein DAYSLEEPER [Linum grandiflorum]